MSASGSSRMPSFNMASLMMRAVGIGLVIVMQRPRLRVLCAPSKRPEQPNAHGVLVVVIVDQTLPIPRKHMGIALDMPNQREGPAQLDRTPIGREIRRNKAE